MAYPYKQELTVSDRVIVSTQRDMSAPLPGVVFAVKPSGCDILVSMHGGRNVLLFSCWHVDDPRAKDAQAFQAHFNLQKGAENRASTGVFRLAAGEELIKHLPKRIEGIERLLESLQGQIAALRVEREASAPKRSRKAKTALPEPAMTS